MFGKKANDNVQARRSCNECGLLIGWGAQFIHAREDSTRIAKVYCRQHHKPYEIMRESIYYGDRPRFYKIMEVTAEGVPIGYFQAPTPETGGKDATNSFTPLSADTI